MSAWGVFLQLIKRASVQTELLVRSWRYMCGRSPVEEIWLIGLEIRCKGTSRERNVAGLWASPGRE